MIAVPEGIWYARAISCGASSGRVPDFVHGRKTRTMAENRRRVRVMKSKPRDDSIRLVVSPPSERLSKGYARDEGLVSLMTGLKFDYRDNDPSVQCPSCGEHVAIEKGFCPACHELIRAKDPYALEAQVLPVIDAANVVYVHLDVDTGNLKFVLRTDQARTELQEIHLDDASNMVPHFE